MKKLIASVVLLVAGAIGAHADTTTSRFGLTKPDVGSTNWGPKLNTNADTIDGAAGQTLSNTFTNNNTFNAGTTFNAQTQSTNGSAATPSISFSSFTTTGLFANAGPVMGLVVNGTTVAYVNSNGLTIYGSRPWKDVTARGAVCDGATDDRGPINSMFAAATAGDIFFFPPGVTCVTGGRVNLPSVDNVTIIAYGATLKLKNSANSDILATANYPAIGGGNNMTIEGLTIDGNAPNNTGNGSDAFYGVAGLTLRDVTAKSGQGVGLFIIGCSTASLYNCMVSSFHASGFAAYNGSSHVNWYNCKAFNNSPNFLLEGLEADGQSRSSDLNIRGGMAVKTQNNLDNVEVYDGVTGWSISDMFIASASAMGINVYSATSTVMHSTNSLENPFGRIHHCLIVDNGLGTLSSEAVKIWDSSSGGKHYISSDTIVDDNIMVDDQASKTQSTCLSIQVDQDYIFAHHNNCRLNVSPNVSVGGGVNTHGALWDNYGDTGNVSTIPGTIQAAGVIGRTLLEAGPSALSNASGQAAQVNGDIAVGGATRRVVNVDNNGLQLGANKLTYVTLDSSGHFGVSSSTPAPTERLEVRGTGTTYAFMASSSAASGTPVALGVTNAGNVTMAGTLAVTGNISASSDKLKGSNSSASVNFRYISGMTNGTTQQIANSDALTPSAIAFVVSDNGSAIISLRNGFNSVVIMSDPSSQFSTTSGTANKTNVYYDAGNSRYSIENETGGTRTYAIFYLQQGG